jgi:5-methylcytosine-specific restriction endonuclease McrA
MSGAAGKWGQGVLDTANKKKRHERLAEARSKGTHTSAEWAALVHFCAGRCVICKAADLEIVKDHILPIYQGGSDSIDNLQPACRACNARKGSDSTDHRPSGWQAFLNTRAPANSAANSDDDACEAPAERMPTSGNRQGQGQGERQGESKYASSSDGRLSARDDPAVALRIGIRKAFERANSPSLPDTSRASVWIAQGYRADLCLAVIAEQLARKPGISTLAYFDNAIREAHEKRAPKGTNGAHQQPGETMVDCRSGPPIAERNLVAMIDRWVASGFEAWPENTYAGDPPGSPGCGIPRKYWPEQMPGGDERPAA